MGRSRVQARRRLETSVVVMMRRTYASGYSIALIRPQFTHGLLQGSLQQVLGTAGRRRQQVGQAIERAPPGADELGEVLVLVHASPPCLDYPSQRDGPAIGFAGARDFLSAVVTRS